MRCAAAALVSFLFAFNPAGAWSAESLDARGIIKAAVDYWRDASSYSEAVLTIHRPDWERVMVIRVWTKGEKKSLVRVMAPPKDVGNSTLLVDGGMWTFTPKVNRVIRIPSSFMNQSWMGSDFSNNDLAKADDLIDQYTHRLLGRELQDGTTVYAIESIPKESAPVVWGREIVAIRSDHIISRHAFFDQEGVLVKTLVTEKIEVMGEKPIASIQRMIRADEPDEWTRVETREARFGPQIPEGIFSLANLRNPREKP